MELLESSDSRLGLTEQFLVALLSGVVVDGIYTLGD